MVKFYLTQLPFIIFLLVCILSPTQMAPAATVSVSCSSDALIAAINNANNSPEDDILELQAGCNYLLTKSNNTTNGANGLPVIADETTAGNLTINGNGATIMRAEHHVWLPLLIRAGTSLSSVSAHSESMSLQTSSAAGLPDFRIIFVASGGHLILNVVTLRNGNLPNDYGGGIFNSGTLIINGSTIADNNASVGGGIYNIGNLAVYENTISGNTAGSAGGGISSGGGAISVSATLFTGNIAFIGDGIFVAEGESTIANLAFDGDESFTCPAFPRTIPAGEAAQLIEAIHCANGSITNDVINLTNSTYTLSTASNMDSVLGDNGLPVIQNAAMAGTLTINGNSATIARSTAPGTPNFRLFMIGSGGELTLNQMTVRNGHMPGFNGGGIEVYYGKLLLNNSVVTGNTAAFGGGMAGDGMVTVTNSTFSANTSIGDGAAINSAGTLIVSNSLITGNTSQSLGGGILTPEGTLVVTDTTFSNNTANAMAGGGGVLVIFATATISGCTFSDNNGSGSGGGLFNGGGNVTVTNSTFARNAAYNGGAIWNGGNLTVSHSTISGNSANGEGGGIFRAGETAVINIRHTIVSGNTTNISGPDIWGTVVSQGYNIISNSSGATITGDAITNLVDAAATPLNLSPLQNNGGPTETMSLGPGSVAIDAGNPAFVTPPEFDQRGSGFPRVNGGKIDIGAYERGS